MTTLIRTGMLPDVRTTLSRLGVEPDTVIEAAGIAPEVLDRPDSFIPYRTFRSLLVESARATGCERFGFYMSEHLGPQSLGVVGFAMQQASTVEEAFEVLAKFLHLHDQHGRILIDQRDTYFRMRYVIDDMQLPGAIQAIDIAAAFGHNLLAALVGEEVQIERMEFPYTKPVSMSPYRFLNCRSLRFDAQDFALLVDPQLMMVEIPNRDPRMGQMLVDYMQQLDERTGAAKADKVERVVTDLLSTGDCTLERVAIFFCVTPRTLQNWLKQEGTTFHEIVENVRRVLAMQYLRTDGMRLTDIAQLLGYTDSSTFTRSFRRWYGESPSRWRQGQSQSASI
jgi:AraC-like DNA-binding protein